MNIRRLLVIGFLVISFAACRQTKEPDRKPLVTVSILPQQYFAERIAGDRYEVFVLVQPGTSPETFELSPGDLQKVASSRLIFLNGYLDFEMTLASKVGQLSAGAVMTDLSREVELISSREERAREDGHEDHHHGGVDPHYWVSPKEMAVAATAMCRAFIKDDPENGRFYEANLDSLLKDIRQLDSTLSASFRGLANRKFIVFHPSLSYLARDYGLEQFSMEHEGKSPSPRRMAELIDLAKAAGIHTVLKQSQFDSHNMGTLAAELGGTEVEIDPLQASWLENMKDIGRKLKEAMDGK